MREPRMADLCCGLGGMTLAFSRAGYPCVFACDSDEAPCDVYEANHGFQPAGDLAGIDPDRVPDHEVCVAGLPCQPHSAAGLQQGLDDSRSHVLYHLLRILGRKRPQAVVIENVPGLASLDGGRALRLIRESLRALGYRTTWRVLRACDAGAAQVRARLFLIGSKGRRFDFGGLRTRPPGRIADFLDPGVRDDWLPPGQYVLLERPRPGRLGLLFAGHMRARTRRRPQGDPSRAWTHDLYRQIYAAEGLGPTLMASTRSRYLVAAGGRVRRIGLDDYRRLMDFPAGFRLGGGIEEGCVQLGNSVYVPLVQEIARQIREQLLSEVIR